MVNWLSKIAMFVSAALVAAFTIPRTLLFIANALPPADQVYAYFALGAFDLGIVVWVLYLVRGARSIPQFGIAATMVVACVAGVVTTLGADMVLNAQSNGVIASQSPDMARLAIYACVGIFALNIVAKIGITVTEPEIIERIKEALTQAKITDEYFKEIDARAPTVAKALADRRAGDWEQKMSYLNDRHIEREQKARQLEPLDNNVSRIQPPRMTPLDHVKAALNGNGNGKGPDSPNG